MAPVWDSQSKKSIRYLIAFEYKTTDDLHDYLSVVRISVSESHNNRRCEIRKSFSNTFWSLILRPLSPAPVDNCPPLSPFLRLCYGPLLPNHPFIHPIIHLRIHSGWSSSSVVVPCGQNPGSETEDSNVSLNALPSMIHLGHGFILRTKETNVAHRFMRQLQISTSYM